MNPIVDLLRRLGHELDAPTVLLAFGVGLLAAGAWMVWRPAGLLVPGAVITWLVLPARVAFIVRAPRGKAE